MTLSTWKTGVILGLTALSAISASLPAFGQVVPRGVDSPPAPPPPPPAPPPPPPAPPVAHVSHWRHHHHWRHHRRHHYRPVIRHRGVDSPPAPPSPPSATPHP